MVDASTVQRLSAGLAMLVYAYLALTAGRRGGSRALVAVVGFLPILGWVLAPGHFAAFAILLEPRWARVGVLLAAATVGLLYAAMRRRRAGTSAQIAAAVGLVVAMTITSSNWVVALSAALCTSACAAISLAGASPGGVPAPPPDRRDDRR